MMQTDLDNLRERIKRFNTQLGLNSGVGFSQTIRTDGTELTTTINGVKTLVQFTDEVETLAIWVWSFKDYLKEYALANGKVSKIVEDHVNSRWFLQIVSDLANRAKHGKLRESRSGKFACFAEAKISIPHESIGLINLMANEIIFNVIQSDNVEFSIPVNDKNAFEIGDGVEILNTAMEDWDDIYKVIIM